MYKVLISAPYMQPVIERFRPIFEKHHIDLVIPEVHERLEEDELLAIMGDIDGVIAGDDRFTAKVIQNSPKLKVLSKWGTGIDSFDKEACQSAGVAIRNTENAFSEPVADSVLGYILSFARRLPWMDTQMKAGIWDKIAGHALHESTLGVIGVGNVGKAVIKRAHAFGMTIIATDPIRPSDEFLAQYDVTMTSLDDLLKNADYVSTNCDLNPSSQHIMNAETFALMKPTAVLINTARGPLIDENALVSALQNGEIAGVAMDVFEDEPLPDNSPLRQMDNVMLAPHNSNSSPTAWEHVHHNTIKNLLDVLGLSDD
ncbi:MAG: hydroxyacid dehydrogenase [Phototrophicaceae bacterium]